MKATVVIACLVATAGAAQAHTILYDTFNEADQADLFDCCSSVPIGGLKALRTHTSAAVPFTVTVKIKIVEIDIPLFHTQGDFDDMKLVIVGEHGNKHSFQITGLDSAGQCCAFKTVTARGVAVAPGVNYSIFVHGIMRTLGGWNLNTAGASGSYTTWDQNGEHQQNGTLPAMRIMGR